jgi:hypothetical protein
MNKTTIIIVLLVIVGAIKQTFYDKEIKKEDKTNLPCLLSAKVGNVEICIPEIDGMHECHLNLSIIKRTSSFNHNGNSIIGFYINDFYYKNIDKAEEMKFDDYCQIYTIKKIEQLNISEQLFEQFIDQTDTVVSKEYWNKIKYPLEKKNENSTFSKPVLLENYSLKQNVKSQVLISKINMLDDENVMICVINYMLIKNKIIFLGYYKKYEGEESIKNAKAKNDYITLRFIEENK